MTQLDTVISLLRDIRGALLSAIREPSTAHWGRSMLRRLRRVDPTDRRAIVRIAREVESRGLVIAEGPGPQVLDVAIYRGGPGAGPSYWAVVTEAESDADRSAALAAAQALDPNASDEWDATYLIHTLWFSSQALADQFVSQHGGERMTEHGDPGNEGYY